MVELAAWDTFVQSHPRGHILQTTAWGQLKAAFGWQPACVRAGASGALVLFRGLPLGLSLGYVPRGPLTDWNDPTGLDRLVAELDALCRARRAAFLKLEPDLPDSAGCAKLLRLLGFRPSPQTVQPRRSLVVDLSGSEHDVLARMKQKTRYNIGLAGKRGVTVQAAQSEDDFSRFGALIQATGARDRFGVHTPNYYRRAFDLFHPAGACELMLAQCGGELLAGVMAFRHGDGAWYFYGASSNRERQRMAPYLAQWAAMRWARAAGALSYDLWGVPDQDEAALEAGFEGRHDGLWGVYRFKRGFGGRLVRTVGAWDRVYNPGVYAAYRTYVGVRGASLG